MPFGRLERRPAPRPFSEINMTPLIDVMLVLLVIFIVAAPLAAQRLVLQLPRTATPPAAPTAEPRASLTVEIAADGALRLDGGAPLAEGDWPRQLTLAAQARPGLELHLRADTAVPYGRVAEVMAAARAAGIARIGFAVQPGPFLESRSPPRASPP